MSLRLLHRRLAVLMGLTGLLAFAGGAGFEPLSAALGVLALLVALFWHPDRELSARLERVWLPLATILVLRALFHVFVVRDDVVIPVVDLLLLLMAAEALRSLDAPNDLRMYALSFALILASTAYRPGILFLVAFIGYVGLGTLTLMVGHLRRRAELHRIREVPLGRALVRTTWGLSGVILLLSGLVFVSFPRISRGWAGRGETLATSIAGFSDEVSIGEHGSRIYGNPEIVLRVEFPAGPPANIQSLHWRGRSYDRFDGVRWTRSRRLPPSGSPGTWVRENWPPERLEQLIYGAPLDVRVLFTLGPVVSIEGHNGIQPVGDSHGDLVYWGSGAPAYHVLSVPSTPPAAELRAAERGYTPSDRYFLDLPDDLDQRVPALADSLTAGLDTRYDRVVAIRDWLRTFEYTLDLPPTAAEATLEHFLFERRAGHCEYFSTALAVLLRAEGIQARNVNGFLGGEWSDFGDYLVVTQNDAHSWTEVWFPDYGWVPFDATPPGAGSSERAGAWFWPGRILLDGIQHRWSKWVLDYDVESQFGLLRRWSGLLEPERLVQAVSGVSAEGGRRLLGLVVIVLVVAVGFGWARRGSHTRAPETSMYLKLRDACTRAGLGVSPGLTPLALVERVRERRSAAARAAERVVDLYLRGRFGHERLGESELREMREALAAARRALRDRRMAEPGAA